jgi:hypothetical protein
VIRFAPALAGRFARLVLAVASIVTLTSCGSGAVSGPVPVNDPTRITILPATATAFPGLPTTFVISGGTGAYIVSSSNQSIIQVAGSLPGSTLTIFPNSVLVDTDVTLSVRDTGTAPVATALVTVRPGTVNNNITVTPTGSQAASCAPALCSGGDALVSATIAQGGIPLPARGVRFDVVTGDFRFVTTDPATGVETLSASVTVISDQAGNAVARIRANAGAANQTALLQVTDIGTSAFQRTSFVIAQSTGSSPGFFVTPTQITFQGTRQNECANSGSASVVVFGGVPPYTVSNTSPFFVSTSFIPSSGGSYAVTPNGPCVAAPGAPIVVTDSAGHTATTTVANIPGTTAPPVLTASPSKITLSSCTGSASVTVAGGAPRGGYLVSFGSNAITGNVSGNTVTILRANPSPATAGPVNVGVSDGITTASVEVDLTGEGAGACPALIASPPSVTLSSCSAVTVTISGGSGTYTAASSDSSVTVPSTTFPSTFDVKRTPGSTSFTTPATVTVTDTSNPAKTISIPVTGTGIGATGPC